MGSSQDGVTAEAGEKGISAHLSCSHIGQFRDLGSLKGVSLMSRMHENYCTLAIVHTRLTANKKRYNFSALKTCVQKNTHKGVKQKRVKTGQTKPAKMNQ